MAMSENAKKAFLKLQSMGVPVIEGEKDHVAFYMSWANGDVTEIYADYSGSRHHRDYLIDQGAKYIRRIRLDIHLIFKEYDLVTDWNSPGDVVVYNDSDAPGCKHSEIDEEEYEW